jgi:hypothetical protein
MPSRVGAPVLQCATVCLRGEGASREKDVCVQNSTIPKDTSTTSRNFNL